MPGAAVSVKVCRRVVARKRSVTVKTTLSVTTKLRLSDDARPGLRRERAGDGFRYRDAAGRVVNDEKVLARVRALAIPPAWDDVWVCPSASGHIQATGRDARGRKQYRYHPAWTHARGAAKFARMAGFGRVLPKIRDRIEADLALSGLPRTKVLAAVVKLLDRTHLRVGSAEYARSNKSFGLSTLLDRHARFGGGGLTLKFRGKSGVWHERSVSDRKLAAVVRRCRDLPGQDLFQYVDDAGRPRPVGSADVNGYIRAAAGGEYTAKDFRTWAGTVTAAARLAALPAPETAAAGERAVVGVIKEVAAVLGNTPAVCRKSYVHPGVIEAFQAGGLPGAKEADGLSADEARVLKLLRSS